MRRITWVCMVTVVCLTAFVPALASAQRGRRQQQQQQQGPSAEDRERAREAYGRGQRLFNEGNFTEAETAFEEAYAAVPNPVVLVGIGESRERLGNVDGAIETFERYLAERPDAPDRTRIEGRIEALRNRPATLVLSSTPSGATIVIDGVPTDDTTPAEVEVEPGEHQVELRLDGHEGATETVQATRGGRHEIALELADTGGSEEVVDHEIDGDDAVEEPEPAPEDDGAGVPLGVWVASAFAGAGLLAGTVLGFLALSEQADFDAMPNEESADAGETLALFADVGFGVAAAAAITAIVLYLTSRGDDEAEAGESGDAESEARFQIAPAIARDAGGVSARVSF